MSLPYPGVCVATPLGPRQNSPCRRPGRPRNGQGSHRTLTTRPLAPPQAHPIPPAHPSRTNLKAGANQGFCRAPFPGRKGGGGGREARREEEAVRGFKKPSPPTSPRTQSRERRKNTKGSEAAAKSSTRR